MSKVLAYTFSEASSTVRDYSESGYDGTGTGLSFANSDFNTNTGKDCIFNAGSDQIDCGTMNELNGSTSLTIGWRFKINSTTGTTQILYKNGQLSFTFDYTTNQITVQMTVASGTASITYGLVVGTWYDIGVSWASNILYLSVDGTVVATDATESGAVANGSGNFYVGYNPDTGDGATYMNLNELLIFDAVLTADQSTAALNSPCGLLSTSNTDAFENGDIIATDIDFSIKYAIVSWYNSSNGDLRIYPMSSGITSGSIFRRVGHLWDTTRQWGLKIDDTPQICFYDGQSLTSEVFTDAKKIVCITKNGIVDSVATKTTNYTVTNTDGFLIADTVTAASDLTFTMPSSPITGKTYPMAVLTGGSYKLVINGNGKNINGSSTKNILSNYDCVNLFYTGTEYIIK